MSTAWTVYESPLGPLTLVGRGGVLSALCFPGRGPEHHTADHDAEALAEASRQLEEYFAGVRRHFELDLDLDGGTAFQRAVWSELVELPYGSTVSYGELARRVGRPDRVRAVAGAVARTPVPIVLPCHRVVGADGSLTGYGGGLGRKAALLALEGTRVDTSRQLALEL
jgi:methylated-DNA-[protein]-cysteine S-methyltransferase